ncbi:MAG: MerR family transcriptional regulator [Candidatus Limnocylindrales bacterium]
MYTIKQAAQRSGVPVSLLRAWERRYGVVAPARSSGGYRLYDEESIARLRAMKVLVDGGWAASQAAATVLAEPDRVRDMIGTEETRGSAGEAGRGSPLADDDVLVRAARDYDSVAIEGVLDTLLGRGSYESVIDDLVLPAVAALGTAWEDGRLDVAGEHLASAAVLRRLASLFDLAGAPRAGPVVVVGLPSGARHEIGTLAFAVALRRHGTRVLYLGQDVPTSSWVHVTGGRVAGVVIGVPRMEDVAAAREVVAALHRERPGLRVALGGPGAGEAAQPGNRAIGPRISDAAASAAEFLGTN